MTARKKAAPRVAGADGLVPVRFLRHYRIYNEDEVAAFGPDEAAELVEAKIAEAVEVEAPKPEGGGA